MDTQTIEVTFDGQVFRPDTPPTDLKPNTRLRIHVETPDEPAPEIDQSKKVYTGNAWDILDAMTGTVEGPSDWAERHDYYLNRRNKRDIAETE